MPSPIKNILITKWLIICIWCPCPILFAYLGKNIVLSLYYTHTLSTYTICSHYMMSALTPISILERMQFSSFELRLERLTKNHSSIINSLFGLHFTASTGVFLEKALYMLCALCMLWLVHICSSIHTSHMCEASNYKNQNGKFWTGAG